jgi:ABC-type transport system substrate-binding protein
MRTSTSSLRSMKIAAGAAAVALLAAACGGDDGAGDAEDGAAEEPTVAEGGTLRIYSSEPAFLVPTAADDQPSILVVRQLYKGLVDYDADGAPVNDLAESIDSDDNQTWTITIKEGYTFHNGEPVDADAFIRAWNYAADGDNAQNNGYFYSRFAGIEESQEGVDELSGVGKVDDMTIEVELNAPFVGFPAILGYSGFFPVAEECLADFEVCNETPIGNGPYQIEGQWQHNVGITLTRYEDYPDEGKSNPDTLEYKIYADVQTGYADFQAGELDVMYMVPPERIAEVEQNQGERIYAEAGNSFTYLGMPYYLEEFDDVNVRRALSMAVDRQAIIDAIFDGASVPATGVVAPTFDGAREGVCQYCEFNPEEAQRLLEEAGGWPGGTLVLEANAGAGHEDWVQAVGDQLRENLGIDYELQVNLDFPEYLERNDAKEHEGAYRLGWGPDYPVMETFLKPLYGTGSGSNGTGYSNPEFDELVAQGDSAETLDEAIEFYQQAEDIIAQDMPVIPLWWRRDTAIWSENVEQFVWNPINEPEYGQMVVAQQ